MSLLLRVFKEIKEINLQAKKIVEQANAQAEKINKEANQKALEAYRIAYNNILEKTKKEIAELKLIKEKDTENELDKIKTESEKIAKEIELKSKSNFEKANDYVLYTILGEL